MAFGIPSEDFHGGFGLPHDEDCDSHADKFTFCDPTDEELESEAENVHNELIRSLVEAGGEIRQLNEDKMVLIYNLKEMVKWLDHFITTNPENLYTEEARTALWVAECCLMDMEDK